MMIWYLILWSVTVPPFEAGQYLSQERCEAAAKVQVVGLQDVYGSNRLKWKCEPRIGG